MLPLPQKQSSTTSPFLEEFCIRVFKIDMGFSMGYYLLNFLNILRLLGVLFHIALDKTPATPKTTPTIKKSQGVASYKP